jgi:two-component system, cell cycle sensor histidine kinase and response regulator CckA
MITNEFVNHKESNVNHQETEEDLREGERKYRNLADSLPQTVAEIDIAGNITFANLASFEMFGYIKQDFDRGLNIYQMIAPEEHQRAMENIQEFMKGQGQNGEEYIGVRKDGSRFPFTVYLTPVLRENKTVGFRIILIDINDRKRSEEALRTSQMQLSEAMDLAHIVHWEFDTATQTYIFNDPFYAFYGTTAEQEGGYLVSREDYAKRFIHPDDIPLYYQFVKENTLRPDTELWADNERRIIRRNGEVRHILVRTRVLKDGSGRIVKRYGVNQDITERKRMEKTLQESEKRYRLLADNATDVIFVFGFDMKYKYISPSVKKVRGFSPEEIVGQPVSYSIKAEGLESMRRAIKEELEVDRTGTADPDRIRVMELEMLCKDGSSIWTEVKASALRNDNGEPIEIMGIARDITERKKIENALRESEARTRAMSDSAQDAILVMDPKGHISYWNPAAERTLGYTSDEAIGKNLHQLIAPQRYHEAHHTAFDMFKQTGQGNAINSTLELEACRKDGHEISVELSLSAFCLKNGWHTVGILRDITERKQAEEALHKSEEKYRLIFDYSPIGLLSFDEKGVIIACNDNFVKIIGSSREKLIGLNMVNLPDKNIVSAVQKALNGSQGFYEGVYSSVTAKKNTPVRCLFAPMNVGGGGITGGVGIIEDISDRKRAEEERQKLHERLQHAHKMESIGTLAGGIAHDFNNLLMGIQGCASLMMLDLDPSHPHYERLKQIEEQVNSGASLTGQLLGFARGGRYEVKPTDINDLIKRTSSMFGRTKKEIVIHQKYVKDLWSVEVDRGQMEQVFMNLYVNAWQAMPGGGEIYLETENVLLDDKQAFSYAIKPGRYIKISMTDTGTGMDEKTKERIFDPFFTTKELGRGTGLGLAMVYGIIKNHNGHIDVISESGKGTTFALYLPASEREIVREKPVTPKIITGTGTILLVDDEPHVLAVSKTILESLGYKVYGVRDGKEAIALYREKKDEVDLIILDMIMPGLSGGETYDLIRELNPSAKIILSSGYSLNDEAQRIMDKGCHGFIQKPFNVAAISRKVREVLET